MNPRIRLALFATGLFIAGCGDGLVPVRGTVTLDGSPLADGTIIFEAVDGRSTPVSSPVKAGAYELRIAPGAKKVRVNASKVGFVDPVMKTAMPESAIPRRYNTETTLTAEVRPGSQEPIDFPLTGDP